MTARLTSEERRLFTLVAQAARTNPFTDRRDMLDFKIASADGEGIPTGGSDGDVMETVIAKVDRSMAVLRQEEWADIRKYSGQDRTLVERVFLFDLFHPFIPHFDTLIADQMPSVERNLPVPFASKVLGMFCERGFSKADAKRYFELYFPMRM